MDHRKFLNIFSQILDKFFSSSSLQENDISTIEKESPRFDLYSMYGSRSTGDKDFVK